MESAPVSPEEITSELRRERGHPARSLTASIAGKSRRAVQAPTTQKGYDPVSLFEMVVLRCRDFFYPPALTVFYTGLASPDGSRDPM